MAKKKRVSRKKKEEELVEEENQAAVEEDFDENDEEELEVKEPKPVDFSEHSGLLKLQYVGPKRRCPVEMDQ